MTLSQTELARYLGRGGDTLPPALCALAEQCGRELFCRYRPRRTGRRLSLDALPPFASRDLTKHLDGCTAVYLTALTLGNEADRLLRFWAVQGMAKATMGHALAAVWLDDCCDAYAQELGGHLQDGEHLLPAYSPGYGDFPLYALHPNRLSLPKGELNMDFLHALQHGRLFLDGGMGSMLQEAGLPEGLPPDVWNIERPDAIQAVHRAYLDAGCDLLTTNTFGATPEKLAPHGYDVEEVVHAAVQNARRAIQTAVRPVFIAVDLGPTGRLLSPYGDLDFEDAVSAFVPLCRAAEAAGADCILIETMSDLYETKAAVLAAKEHCHLPILVSLIFDAQGKLLTGGDAPSTVALLEGLGVCAFGVNCGLGPQHLAPVLQELWHWASTPLLCQPNAGLPETQDGKTIYRVSPEAFAVQMRALAPYARLLGGCCGTTPAHLAAMITACRALPPPETTKKRRLLVSSYCRAVSFGEGAVLIGERINPTGKKALQTALRTNDASYLLREAIAQEEAGAQILDINVGLPDLDEGRLLSETVERIQAISPLPLQLDSADPRAISRALRRYNGKPLVNSVSGKQESLDAILPLVQHYGGGLVCLTLDEDGIPASVEGRLAIARRMVTEAKRYGIEAHELLIDALTLPVSAGEDNARVTLETLRRAKAELGVSTVLGLSNISFGLPCRDLLNTAFFTLALEAGLDGAILNPKSEQMLGAFRAFRALRGLDKQSAAYIESYRGERTSVPSLSAPTGKSTLFDAVCRGLCAQADEEARRVLETGAPVLHAIQESLLPALDEVGRGFETGRLFLPQLLLSAEAAKAAFALLREGLPAADAQEDWLVILATVQGDIHDIGKNIVKVLLESHRFRVLDLGRDVPPADIVVAVREHKAKLLGLSALMTTTAPAMAETIRQLRAAGLDTRVMVGGAVITADYAKDINADNYAADAMEGVRIAKQVFGTENKCNNQDAKQGF